MANLFFRTNVAPYRIDTYNALHDELDFELYFLYDYDPSQSYDMGKLYEQCTFTPHICKSVNILKHKYKFVREVGKLIKQNDPDIIIVPEFKILCLQILMYKWIHRSRFKVISMCDDSYDMVSNDHDFSLLHKLARKLAVPRLDDLLLVDSKVVVWYKEHFGKGIWLPIIRDDRKESKNYERVIPISTQLQERFELKGQRVLLYVGRLVAVKNIKRVIESLNHCKEAFTFVIVGSGEEKESLRSAATNCTHKVIFAGRYEGDEVRAWYNLADVFILPSTKEAYGAVTNEALLAGCRCAISNRCGSTCLIDQSNGLTFDPMDVNSIAGTLDSLFSGVEAANSICRKNNLMSFSFKDTINCLKQSLKL